MIIPKVFLKTLKRTGLGKSLFYEMRFDSDGRPNPDFILNRTSFDTAQVLFAGGNFGCGSSREHAPWALKDFGIRCIISTSYADIFYNNCFKNAILPAIISQADFVKIQSFVEADAVCFASVDLNKQVREVENGGKKISAEFSIPSDKKHILLNGLDDIEMTLKDANKIDVFEYSDAQRKPWLYAR